MEAATLSPTARAAAAYADPPGTALATRPNSFDLSPQNFEQALVFAGYLADSDLVPKDYKGKPGNCLIAMQWGAELGLKPLQALQNIALINGRPSLWGDVMLALVRASPLCEYVVESIEGERAVCRVKRRGEPEQVREFTKADAEMAKLWGKEGPWRNYPKRMLQMRARAWALRDVFTDILKGLHMAEEAMDMPAEKYMGPVQYVQEGATPAPEPTAAPTATPAPASTGLPILDKAAFDEKLPTWRQMIAGGQKTADRMVSFLRTKYALTDDQEKAIRRHPYTTTTSAPAPAADDTGPAVTYESVVSKLETAAGAKDKEAFEAAADLIGSIPNPTDRGEASQLYQRLLPEFLATQE